MTKCDLGFIPSGYLALSEAVNVVGRTLFPVEWSGKEISQLRRPPPGKTLQRVEEAIAILRNLLATDEVPAKALAEDGEWFPVPTHFWLGERGRQLFDHGWLPHADLKAAMQARREGSLKRRILVAERNLTEWAEGHNRSGAKPASTIAAETRCTEWLAAMMRDGPPQTGKPDYLRQAQEQFGISQRGFNRAWGVAVARTGNRDWIKPGRRSKS